MHQSIYDLVFRFSIKNYCIISLSQPTIRGNFDCSTWPVFRGPYRVWIFSTMPPPTLARVKILLFFSLFEIVPSPATCSEWKMARHTFFTGSSAAERFSWIPADHRLLHCSYHIPAAVPSRWKPIFSSRSRYFDDAVFWRFYSMSNEIDCYFIRPLYSVKPHLIKNKNKTFLLLNVEKFSVFLSPLIYKLFKQRNVPNNYGFILIFSTVFFFYWISRLYDFSARLTTGFSVLINWKLLFFFSQEIW